MKQQDAPHELRDPVVPTVRGKDSQAADTASGGTQTPRVPNAAHAESLTGQ